MKKYLPFGAGLLPLLLSSASFAQETAKPSPSPKPKPAMNKGQVQRNLIATEKKFWEAWKNRDLKVFKAGLTPDSVMIGENGVEGKEAAIKELTDMSCNVTSYSLSDFKMHLITSSTALLTYKGAAQGSCAGNPVPTVWASTVFVNHAGKWYAFAHQETNAK